MKESTEDCGKKMDNEKVPPPKSPASITSNTSQLSNSNYETIGATSPSHEQTLERSNSRRERNTLGNSRHPSAHDDVVEPGKNGKVNPPPKSHRSPPRGEGQEESSMLPTRTDEKSNTPKHAQTAQHNNLGNNSTSHRIKETSAQHPNQFVPHTQYAMLEEEQSDGDELSETQPPLGQVAAKWRATTSPRRKLTPSNRAMIDRISDSLQSPLYKSPFTSDDENGPSDGNLHKGCLEDASDDEESYPDTIYTRSNADDTASDKLARRKHDHRSAPASTSLNALIEAFPQSQAANRGRVSGPRKARRPSDEVRAEQAALARKREQTSSKRAQCGQKEATGGVGEDERPMAGNKNREMRTTPTLFSDYNSPPPPNPITRKLPSFEEYFEEGGCVVLEEHELPLKARESSSGTSLTSRNRTSNAASLADKNDSRERSTMVSQVKSKHTHSSALKRRSEDSDDNIFAPSQVARMKKVRDENTFPSNQSRGGDSSRNNVDDNDDEEVTVLSPRGTPARIRASEDSEADRSAPQPSYKRKNMQTDNCASLTRVRNKERSIKTLYSDDDSIVAPSHQQTPARRQPRASEDSEDDDFVSTKKRKMKQPEHSASSTRVRDQERSGSKPVRTIGSGDDVAAPSHQHPSAKVAASSKQPPPVYQQPSRVIPPTERSRNGSRMSLLQEQLSQLPRGPRLTGRMSQHLPASRTRGFEYEEHLEERRVIRGTPARTTTTRQEPSNRARRSPGYRMRYDRFDEEEEEGSQDEHEEALHNGPPMDSMAHDEDDLEWSDEEEGMREEESGEEEEEEEDGVSANYPTTARNGTSKQRSIEELEAMACAGRAAEFTEAESAALSQAIRANIRNIDFRKLGKRPTNNVVNMSQQLREARNRVQHAEDLSNMPLRSEASKRQDRKINLMQERTINASLQQYAEWPTEVHSVPLNFLKYSKYAREKNPNSIIGIKVALTKGSMNINAETLHAYQRFSATESGLRFYVTDGVQRLCALMELKEEYDEEYGHASLVNPYDKIAVSVPANHHTTSDDFSMKTAIAMDAMRHPGTEDTLVRKLHKLHNLCEIANITVTKPAALSSVVANRGLKYSNEVVRLVCMPPEIVSLFLNYANSEDTEYNFNTRPFVRTFLAASEVNAKDAGDTLQRLVDHEIKESEASEELSRISSSIVSYLTGIKEPFDKRMAVAIERRLSPAHLRPHLSKIVGEKRALNNQMTLESILTVIQGRNFPIVPFHSAKYVLQNMDPKRFGIDKKNDHTCSLFITNADDWAANHARWRCVLNRKAVPTFILVVDGNAVSMTLNNVQAIDVHVKSAPYKSDDCSYDQVRCALLGSNGGIMYSKASLVEVLEHRGSTCTISSTTLRLLMYFTTPESAPLAAYSENIVHVESSDTKTLAIVAAMCLNSYSTGTRVNANIVDDIATLQRECAATFPIEKPATKKKQAQDGKRRSISDEDDEDDLVDITNYSDKRARREQQQPDTPQHQRHNDRRAMQKTIKRLSTSHRAPPSSQASTVPTPSTPRSSYRDVVGRRDSQHSHGSAANRRSSGSSNAVARRPSQQRFQRNMHETYH